MLISEEEILRRLSTARLPAMPQMLVKLMELFQDDKAGLPELARLVAQDPGMTAKVLRVAQSPAYRRSGQAARLEQSMLALGLDMIRTLVISESIYQTFNSFSASVKSDMRAYWKHSLTTAIIARQIARKTKYSGIDEAYLAGLLHDIGRLALLAVAPAEYAVLFHELPDDKLCAAEHRTLQIDHAEAGARIIEQWRMDNFIADSVLYHHEPVSRILEVHPLIRMVWLAHALASMDADDPYLEPVIRNFSLSAYDLEQIVASVPEMIEQAAKFLDIDLSEPVQPVQAEEIVAPSSRQARLSAEIQNMVHASELGRFFSGFQEQEQLAKAICGTACSEFLFDTVCLMTRNEAGDALVANPVGESQQRLEGFSISLARSGPVAEAAMKSQINVLSTGSTANGIAEEQLLRILDSERLLCLPLMCSGSCAGMLIAGSSVAHMEDVRLQERELKILAAQAALALYNMRARSRAAQAQSERLMEEFQDEKRRIAHEVNNPLAIIKNYLRVLDGKLTRQEPIAAEMSILDEELSRVDQIINGYASQAASPATGNESEMADSATDANRCLQHVARLFGETGFAQKVRISAHVHEGPCMTSGSAGKLKQILVNLVKNAVEAMPDGGEIKLASNGRAFKEGAPYISISVKDNGPGIPSAILEKLFTPVQSTKGAGHHGLGLSIVHDLVKEIGGSISCHSGRNGTTFELLVPAVSQTYP